MTSRVTSSARPVRADRRAVNFPESVALPAAFIGTRGAIARAASRRVRRRSSRSIRLHAADRVLQDVFGLYDQADFVRLIVLAVTDTVYRAFYETFRDIAVTYGIYVTAGADVPPAERVYEADDPVAYAAFIDPAEAGVRPTRTSRRRRMP